MMQAKDGFFCTIKLIAKVNLPPNQVYAILARPDSRHVFRSIVVRYQPRVMGGSIRPSSMILQFQSLAANIGLSLDSGAAGNVRCPRMRSTPIRGPMAYSLGIKAQDQGDC